MKKKENAMLTAKIAKRKCDGCSEHKTTAYVRQVKQWLCDTCLKEWLAAREKDAKQKTQFYIA
jgi:hypothetical protein